MFGKLLEFVHVYENKTFWFFKFFFFEILEETRYS